MDELKWVEVPTEKLNPHYSYILYLSNEKEEKALGVIYKHKEDDNFITIYFDNRMKTQKIESKYGIDTAKTLLMLEVTNGQYRMD